MTTKPKEQEGPQLIPVCGECEWLDLTAMMNGFLCMHGSLKEPRYFTGELAPSWCPFLKKDQTNE